LGGRASARFQESGRAGSRSPGGIETLARTPGGLGLAGGTSEAISGLNNDFATLGCVVIAVFALCRAVSAAIERCTRFDATTAER